MKLLVFLMLISSFILTAMGSGYCKGLELKKHGVNQETRWPKVHLRANSNKYIVGEKIIVYAILENRGSFPLKLNLKNTKIDFRTSPANDESKKNIISPVASEIIYKKGVLKSGTIGILGRFEFSSRGLVIRDKFKLFIDVVGLELYSEPLVLELVDETPHLN